MLAVYIATKNTPSGNPQRGWIIFNASGGVAGFVDEEYLGTAALAEAGWGSIPRTAQRIQVMPAEYHGWKKANLKKNKRGSRRAKRTSRRNKRTSRKAR